jgi:hypothetical protein
MHVSLAFSFSIGPLMPVYDEFVAWLEIDGKRVEEYDVEVQNGQSGVEKEVRCWIPSEAGKVGMSRIWRGIS